MLELEIRQTDLWDPVAEIFLSCKGQILALEHSLLSVSKWEAKWHRPFFGTTPLTEEEFIDYVRCMTISRNVDPLIYRCITNDHVKEISEYMLDSHTATWFTEDKKAKKQKPAVMTAERIYHLMFVFGIDKECEKWHINRLLTQIRVEYEESKPAQKKSRKELVEHTRQLNALRRRQAHQTRS